MNDVFSLGKYEPRFYCLKYRGVCVKFQKCLLFAYQLMHIHKIIYIKTFKIAPKCFDPKIIFRELHSSSLKSHF